MILAATLTTPVSFGADGFSYPTTFRSDVSDDYHGTRVADPYRWLEDSKSPEVQRWIEAENALTHAYMQQTNLVNRIRDRIKEDLDYVRYDLPCDQNGVIFFSKNDGLQDQSVLYVQPGLLAKPRLLIDPNRLSDDGTAAMNARSISPDARCIAYGISQNGSDWQDVHVLDVATGKDLPDVIPRLKFRGAAWTQDSKGFFYTRQPTPGTVPAGDEHYFPKLYFHRLGDDPARDQFVFDRPEVKEAGIAPVITDDGRYLVVTVWKGSADNQGRGADSYEIYYKSLASEGKPKPLLTGFDAAYDFVGASGDRFFFNTDKDAPRRRVIAVRVDEEKAPVETVIGEGDDVIIAAAIVNQELWVETMHDAHSRLTAYRLDGSRIDDVALPALGTVVWNGRPRSDLLFVGFTSFLFPFTVYRFDFTSRSLVPMYEPRISFDREGYTTRQVWFNSRDGTRVPMFLVHRKNLRLTGDHPVLLYGYGGFNVAMSPWFSATELTWLEQGGILAVPNIRGGGEFGKSWHEAGMLEKKQNVFDDFIAAAEYLIEGGYTRPGRLAIEGGSNGGLLTAAVEMQRPDLFGAVVIEVPVVDMLRYHLFTVGRFWIPEFGSSENPEQFKFLYAYSPLHRVRPGVNYPATLILTADSDDRVHPGQARKLAATLQSANASKEPILIRVESRAGHGGGTPLSKLLDATADKYAFLFHELEMKLTSSGAK